MLPAMGSTMTAAISSPLRLYHIEPDMTTLGKIIGVAVAVIAADEFDDLFPARIASGVP